MSFSNFKRTRTALMFATALFAGLTSFQNAQAVKMDWVTVGNPGNVADGTGYGAVAHHYRIGKYEVTNAQYVEFLNAVDATGINPNQIYNSSMTSSPRGGIDFNSGAPTGSKYSTKANMANKPVVYVSWFDAARFSNWMTNGQGSGDTESGVYTMSGIFSVSGITRNLSDLNQVFLPTEDEWYKAAYHQPSTLGGDSDDYWLFPTASNPVPALASANSNGDISNPGQNVMNHNLGADWNSQNGNVTTVGSAGALSESFYGTADQGGNVWEWNETLTGVADRLLRGGSWGDVNTSATATQRLPFSPSSEFDGFGFRVAAPIPEPMSVALLALGLPLILRRQR